MRWDSPFAENINYISANQSAHRDKNIGSAWRRQKQILMLNKETEKIGIFNKWKVNMWKTRKHVKKRKGPMLI